MLSKRCLLRLGFKKNLFVGFTGGSRKGVALKVGLSPSSQATPSYVNNRMR